MRVVVHHLAASLLLALVYLGLGVLGLELAVVHGSVTLVWPPTGLAIAALLLGGLRLWPGVALGALATNLLAGDASPLAVAFITVGNTAEAVVAAFALRAIPRFRPTIERSRDLLAYALVAGAAAPLVSALVGVLGLTVAGDAPWAAFDVLLSRWWLGDAIGALVFGPAVIAWWLTPPHRVDRRTLAGVALVTVALVSVTALAWRPGGDALAPGQPAAVFLAFPFVVWAGLRHGLRGASTATLAAAVVAVWGTVAGAEHDPAALDQRIVSLWFFLGVIAVSGLLAVVGLERHRLARALGASERRYRALVDSAPDPIHALDLAGRVVALNAAGVAMARGVPEERLVGQRFVDWVSEPERGHVAALFERALAGETTHFTFTAATEGDAEARVFSSSFVPLRDADGAIERIIGHTRELTAVRRAEAEQARLHEQLLHAQKLESLGVLAGGIAHDFNNLLAVVLGNAELARADLPEDSPAQVSLVAIEEAAQRAASLSGQMLAYSGHGRFEIAAIDIAAEVGAIGELLRVSLPKSAALTLPDPGAGAGEPVIVDADVSQLRQVVLNLITNAADAVSSRGGTIAVRVGTTRCDAEALARMPYAFRGARPGAFAWVEVEDDGVGMSAETQARIFDPFYTTKGQGRGLGLAATLGIVRGHRGAIEVTSAPGEGTRLRLLLPLAEAREAEGPAAAAAAPARTRRDALVLVVDDDVAVRSVARAVLVRAGFQVVEASDGVEALEQAEAHPVEVVVLDLTMPRMDGHAALIELSARWPKLPVILSSGYGDRAARIDRTRPFLRKPWRMQDLVAAIDRALS